MIQQTYRPNPPLDQFIDYFFYYSGYITEHSIDRFLPDGNIYVVFDFSDNPQYIYDNNTLESIQTCRRVWFSGFRTKPITIPSGKDSKMLVVYFKKGRSFPFINVPLEYLQDLVVDAEQVLGKEILEVREQMQESKSLLELFRKLEIFFLDNYCGELVTNNFVDYAIDRISNGSSHLSLGKMYNKIGYSNKHVIKIFKDCVGTTPKEFLKILRFQKTIQDIEMMEEFNWSQLATECGYFDQSHFISDFKHYSGFTPVEYWRRKNHILNYVPVG